MSNTMQGGLSEFNRKEPTTYDAEGAAAESLVSSFCYLENNHTVYFLTDNGKIRWYDRTNELKDDLGNNKEVKKSPEKNLRESEQYNQVVSNEFELVGCTQLIQGHSHCLALNGQGQVWGWGNNKFSQLSSYTNTEDHYNKPVQIIFNKDCLGIYRIYAFGNTSIAVDRMSNVYVWGRNEFDSDFQFDVEFPTQITQICGQKFHLKRDDLFQDKDQGASNENPSSNIHKDRVINTLNEADKLFIKEGRSTESILENLRMLLRDSEAEKTNREEKISQYEKLINKTKRTLEKEDRKEKQKYYRDTLRSYEAQSRIMEKELKEKIDVWQQHREEEKRIMDKVEDLKSSQGQIGIAIQDRIKFLSKEGMMDNGTFLIDNLSYFHHKLEEIHVIFIFFSK